MSFIKKKKSEKCLLTNGRFQVTKVGTNTVSLLYSSNSRAFTTVNISRVQLYFELWSELLTITSDDHIIYKYEIDWILEYQK